MSFYLLIKGLLNRKVVTALLLLQLAMTLALLLNSILLAQQTHQQLNQPTGLDLDNIVLVQLKPTTASLRVYPALEELLNRQLAAVSALPGVVAAAYSNQSAILQGRLPVDHKLPSTRALAQQLLEQLDSHLFIEDVRMAERHDASRW